MEQLGKLIIACAQRRGAVLWMQEGAVHVCVGKGALSKVYSAENHDETAIQKIINEVRDGAYAIDAGAQRKEAT